MIYRCETCDKEVSPATCYVRVTGWGRPGKNGIVKDLFGAAAGHGMLCESCGFDLKNKPDQTQSMF